MRSAREHWFALLATAVGALVVSTLVPGLRAPGVIALAVAALVATVVGVVVHRPVERLPWLLVTGMLAGLLAATLVVSSLGEDAVAACVLVGASQVAAFALQLCLLAGKTGERRGTAPGGAQERGPARHHGIDAFVVALTLALVLAQALLSVTGRPEGSNLWIVASPTVDLFLTCITLRLLTSQRVQSPASLLAGLAALVGLVFDLLVTMSGHRVLTPDAGLCVLYALCCGLFLLGHVHPSMKTAHSPEVLRRVHTESARLVGLLPVVAAPFGLYLVGGGVDQQRLPVQVYLVAGIALTALVVWRGARAVRVSEFHAEHDQLTGLPNRLGLAGSYQRAVGWTQVCVVDVHDFKQVNDAWGDEAGDALLQQVAGRLVAAVGDRGTVARSGGDEFVLLLRGADLEATAVVDAAFGGTFDLAGGQRTLQARVGLVDVGPHDQLPHLMADAAVALAAAKASGSSSVVRYDPSLREAVMGRAALAAELRATLAGEGGAGQLEVHYQPLVDLATGRTTGCEALVRWRHPERGLVPPDSFLPLAEEQGLGALIDRWVLGQAVAHVQRWDAAGPGRLHVSVNLGRSSMLDADLAQGVLAALHSAGVSPDRLHLEITEHEALPAGASAEALALLSEHGVVVSLDDFGIGYTSLDYVRRYPIAYLKLDRSITASLQQEESSPLLRGIVALARSLDIHVLAEGIETAVQATRLHALGITLGQGFHLGRPQPAAQTLGWSGLADHAAGAAVGPVVPADDGVAYRAV